jgi:hypothetical protein
MSTINVDNILSESFIQNPVNLNGTEITYNPNGSIIGIGQGALQSCSTINNVAIGKSALQSVTTGDDNTAVGGGALSATTGTNNTAIGYNAGNLHTTGTNNIFIGFNANGVSPTSNNSITLGDSNIAVLRCAVTSITSLSDARDKKEIKDLSTGLDFVKTLRPVEFTWKDRDENGKQGIADFGFIAQDLKKSQEDAEKAEVLKLVYDENPDKLEASYGKLIPILVKAIQELTAKVEQLEK